MKHYIQAVLVILVLIVTTSCIKQNTYANQDIGIAFNYLSNWELEEYEENAISLKNDDIRGVGIYLLVNQTDSLEGDSSIEILNNLLVSWEQNSSEDTFFVINKPEWVNRNGHDFAISSALFETSLFPNSFGEEIVLTTDYFQEVLVGSQDDRTVIIILRSQGQELDSRMNLQIETVLESFAFTE